MRRQTGVVFMFWHSVLLIPFYYFRRYNAIPLIGAHSDAQLLAQIGERMGYVPIRGSSRRMAYKAAAHLLNTLYHPGQWVIMTPDGPRGPARQVKTGTIKIIQRARSAVIPVGAASSQPFVFNSWDRFQLPKPLSRISLYYGAPVGLENGRADADSMAAEITARINEAQDNALRMING